MEAKVDCKQCIWIYIEPKILCTWMREEMFKVMFINAFILVPKLLTSIYCFILLNEWAKYKIYGRKEKERTKCKILKGRRKVERGRLHLRFLIIFFFSFSPFFFVMILTIATNFYNFITIYWANSLAKVGNGS